MLKSINFLLFILACISFIGALARQALRGYATFITKVIGAAGLYQQCRCQMKSTTVQTLGACAELLIDGAGLFRGGIPLV